MPRDLLRAVFDGVPAMVGYWDRQLRNQMANAAYVEWFGLTPSQMRGAHMRDVLGSTLFEANLPYVEAVLRGEPQLFDRSIVDTQGRERHTQASYIPDLAAGVVEGFFALVTDVSPRVEAEGRVRQLAGQYRDLIRSIPGGFVLLFDHELCFQVADGEALEAFGYSREAMEGRSLADALPEALAAELEPRYRDALRGRSTHWDRRRGDREFSLTCGPVRDGDGVIFAGTVVCTDVTAQRRAAATDRTLQSIAKAVASKASVQAVAELVVQRMHAVFAIGTAAVVRFDELPRYSVLAITPALPFLSGELRFNPDERSAAATVARTGRPAKVAFDGSELGPAAAAYGIGLRAGAGAPITLGNELWGALVITATDERAIDDELLQRLSGFAELVGLAIANAEMMRLLTEQASTDALTDLANRRSFEEHLHREVARATREALPLSLALLDIDHFKRVNDSHGHLVGDHVLAEIARRIRQTARGHDIIARIGGEEFAWLLPGLSLDRAFEPADRARRAIADQPFSDAGTITISIGISQWQPGRDADAFRAAADAMLYAAKRAGRNRTMPVPR